MAEGDWLKTAPISTFSPDACPHRILQPSHYREDGTCKCNDPKERIMHRWGYKWSRKNKQWMVPK